jgi:NAD(P)-dependent dehydrogenase (short-subunit alcohol dehydrogenase family)
MPGLSLDAARDELAGLGGRVLAVACDLGDPAARPGLVGAVEAELGPVDILVNNAAAGGFAPFLDWTDTALAGLLELNFWAPWHLIRATLPGMLERGAGWIVNVSSATAIAPEGPPFPPTAPASLGTMYGGTKAFLNRWTVSLAAEVQGRGVAVNTLAPQAAAETEWLAEHADLADYLYEPRETMAEAALALCTADPVVLTGNVASSLQLLADLDRPVRDLRGEALVPDWQPASLPPRIEKMRAHARGEVVADSNLARVLTPRG